MLEPTFEVWIKTLWKTNPHHDVAFGAGRCRWDARDVRRLDPYTASLVCRSLCPA
jgi:hypothetical protein